jgi:ubiquinone/menaquinone biosynthesis C-methylase UbiE
VTHDAPSSEAPISDPALVHDRPLLEIVAHVKHRLAAGASMVRLEVLDPDHGRGRHAGERVTIAGVAHIHRPLRVWVDLAERLGMRLLTPRTTTPPRIELRLERLDPAADWHTAAAPDPREKYGSCSSFARISKLEDPDFILDFADAIERIGLDPAARVLELGVNRGDALTLLAALVPGLASRGELVGVDHSGSALAVARARFPGANARFIAADLADLDALAALDLGRFDLILAIDTLQSSSIDDRALLRHLVQQRLTPRGAVLLGVANCRYLDGEVVHGARMKNFRQPELGTVIKDLAFYRKYLQQHARAVHVTGKHELLVTALPIA